MLVGRRGSSGKGAMVVFESKKIKRMTERLVDDMTVEELKMIAQTKTSLLTRL